MVMIPLPWAIRRWALPFLTILAPSEHYDKTHWRRHKTMVDWARQGILQIRRWLPNRLIVIVADSGFAAIELIAAVRRHVCFVTRLRLDANLFEPPPPTPPRTGRPSGQEGPQAAQALPGSHRSGHRLDLDRHAGMVRQQALPPGIHNRNRDLVPRRTAAAADPLGAGARPAGIRKPQAFLCTNLDAKPADILGWYVHRWSMETTFQETRTHLGVETQRQWSDLAIARTTPALLGLFSLITLWAAEAKAALHPRMAAWYAKDEPTFSDAIATVRRVLWAFPNFSTSRIKPDNVEIPGALLQRLIEAVCYTT